MDEFQGIVLSESSWSQKVIDHMILLQRNFLKDKIIVIENRSVGPEAGVGGERGYKEAAQTALEDDGASPYLNCSGGYADLYLSLKTEL